VKREFAFEKSINNSLDCLPMSVKRKLDRVALKIGRDQWLGMKAEERKTIWNLPAETEQECETLILFIRKVLAGHRTEARPLPEMAARLSEPPLEVPAP
jgi:Conserved nitrate reductase-associated protein (Nitr_red_assoc)